MIRVLYRSAHVLCGRCELLEGSLLELIEMRSEVMEARLPDEVSEEGDEVLPHVDGVQRVGDSVRILIFVLELVVDAVVGVEETREIDTSTVVETVVMITALVLAVPFVSTVLVFVLFFLSGALQHGAQLANQQFEKFCKKRN